MSGQNPVDNQQPSALQAMSNLHQQTVAAVNVCDNYLNPYREYVGPVKNMQELQMAGQEPDLLSMRFAVIKAFRDEGASMAQDLAQKMAAFQGNGN